jgi:hypothetical protein
MARGPYERTNFVLEEAQRQGTGGYSQRLVRGIANAPAPLLEAMAHDQIVDSLVLDDGTVAYFVPSSHDHDWRVVGHRPGEARLRCEATRCPVGEAWVPNRLPIEVPDA